MRGRREGGEVSIVGKKTSGGGGLSYIYSGAGTSRRKEARGCLFGETKKDPKPCFFVFFLQKKGEKKVTLWGNPRKKPLKEFERAVQNERRKV